MSTDLSALAMCNKARHPHPSVAAPLESIAQCQADALAWCLHTIAPSHGVTEKEHRWVAAV